MSNDECPVCCEICLGVQEKNAVYLNCRHVMCFKCCESWARVKKICPVCRKPFQKVFYAESEEEAILSSSSPMESFSTLSISPEFNNWSPSFWRMIYDLNTEGILDYQPIPIYLPFNRAPRTIFPSGIEDRQIMALAQDNPLLLDKEATGLKHEQKGRKQQQKVANQHFKRNMRASMRNNKR